MSRPKNPNNIPSQKHIDHYHKKPRATHCAKGHEYTKANSMYCYGEDGVIRRRCKKCRSAYYREYHKSNSHVHWTEMLIGGV